MQRNPAKMMIECFGNRVDEFVTYLYNVDDVYFVESSGLLEALGEIGADGFADWSDDDDDYDDDDD